MSLKNIKSKLQAERGFTIVELLIVIVVIGILAAITIVSYNGVTTNARNTQSKTDASAVQKVAETFNADTGAYPTAAADFTSGTAKLPSNVGVAFTTGTVTGSSSSGTADPATNNHTWATYTNTTSGKKFYATKACSTNQGVMVYYLEGTSTLKSVAAGTSC
jgi:prepilin-type N-terminal cleavage/methylation domain-containing protein